MHGCIIREMESTECNGETYCYFSIHFLQALKVAGADSNNNAFKRACVLQALDMCLKRGITHVQTNDWDHFWPVYMELHQQNKLKVRVSLTVPCAELINGLFKSYEFADKPRFVF